MKNLKTVLIATILLITLLSSAEACKDVYSPAEEVVITDVIESDGSGATCNLTLYWGETHNQTGLMNQSDLLYTYNASFLDDGTYSASIECNKTATIYVGECKFRVEEDDKMIIAALILAPLLLGLFFLIGAATLNNEEHRIIKIFLFLMSIITFFTSLHIGAISVAKFYDFPELTELLGTTTYWVGIAFGVIISYFILYLLYNMITHMATQKKSKLKY